MRANPDSGLRRSTCFTAWKAAFGATTRSPISSPASAALPLPHQPGEVWEYSWGVDVLARVVEVVSGQPFDQFLQSRLFAPLHMVDSGF